MTICSLFTRGYPVESWPQLSISAGSPGDRSSQIGHWPPRRRCSNAQWDLAVGPFWAPLGCGNWNMNSSQLGLYMVFLGTIRYMAHKACLSFNNSNSLNLGDSRMAEWIKTGWFQQTSCGFKQQWEFGDLTQKNGRVDQEKLAGWRIQQTWIFEYNNGERYLHKLWYNPYYTPNLSVNRPPLTGFSWDNLRSFGK
jgi:hypothetical protein